MDGNVNNNKNWWKSILIVVAVGFIALYMYNEHVERQKEEYGLALKSAYDLIVENEDETYACGNLLDNVWRNSIFHISDSKTNKYTKQNGQFVKDFNVAIERLNKDKSYSKKIENIENQIIELNQLKKTLNDNVPRKFTQVNDVIVQMIDLYVKRCILIAHPAGSYNDWTGRINDLSIDEQDLYLQITELEPFEL